MSLFKSFAPLQFGKRQMLGTVLLIVGTLLLVSTLFVANPNVGDNETVLNGILSWYRVVVWGLPAAMITGRSRLPLHADSLFPRSAWRSIGRRLLLHLSSLFNCLLHLRPYLSSGCPTWTRRQYHPVPPRHGRRTTLLPVCRKANDPVHQRKVPGSPHGSTLRRNSLRSWTRPLSEPTLPIKLLMPHAPSRRTPGRLFRISPPRGRHGARCHPESSPLVCPAPIAGSPASVVALHTPDHTQP